MDEKILEVKDLKMYFNLGRGQVLKAVDGVSFTLNRGSTLGLVGESGCGKSTTGRAVVGLYEPTGGDVIFEGRDVKTLDKQARRDFVRHAQMIFQDPYSSLDPRMTVGDVIGEGIDIHKLYSGKKRTERIYELLSLVGLAPEHANRFSHEFSGGQRQRVGIARALAVEPRFIVCDEPISALDISIQSQVVNLLLKLQKELSLTYLFISHDLSMVKYISEHVMVMYLGVVAEMAESDELYANPLHPYTKALLASIPIADPNLERARASVPLSGEVPSPVNPPPGCRFAGRCPLAMPICREENPPLFEVSKSHKVACFNVKEVNCR